MPNLHLFFSHRLTDAQKEDALKSLDVEEFVYLPPDLQQLFSNVPPHLESLDEYVRPFAQYLLEVARPGDYILLQGDFGLVYRLVEISKSLGLIPIYATTRRVALERQEGEKSIKLSAFEHVRFRRY